MLVMPTAPFRVSCQRWPRRWPRAAHAWEAWAGLLWHPAAPLQLCRCDPEAKRKGRLRGWHPGAAVLPSLRSARARCTRVL